MKTLPSLGLLLAVAFAPVLHAQDEPPPPMDQGAPPPDQGAPPDQAGDPGAPQDQGAPDDQNGSDASFQTFYDQLSSQGTWVQTDNYGYVWQPPVQDPDWRPYSHGHWVYTDDGWTWLADDSEPWGWATYHYGRWVNIDGEGWVWVPGYTWAPAWVSWRYGGGYCGWAPLPPETTVGIDFGGIGFGFHIGGDCDTAYGIGPGYYNFLPVGYIGARDYRNYYVNRNNNYTIINNTRNVTNIVVNNRAGAGRFGRVTTGGPNFATVNAQSRTPVQRASLMRSNQVGNAAMRGNQLSVYAPRVRAANGARPSNVSGNLTAARVNRGTNIDQPLAVNARVAPVGPSAEQVQAARTAQGHVPGAAHVATASTRPSHHLAAPLTSMQPHATSGGAGAAEHAAVRPATISVNAPVPRAGADRADSAFTGGNPASGPHQRTANPGEGQGEVHPSHHDSAFTPHNQAEAAPTRSAESPAQHQSFTPAEHHETENAPMERHEPAQVERQESAPVERHENAPVTHQSPPIQSHPASAPAVHQAPASHPAPQQHASQHQGGNGGGGGGKPGDQNHH